MDLIIFYFAIVSGATVLLLPRVLDVIYIRWIGFYRIVAAIMAIFILLLQFFYFFFGTWGISERPFPISIPWPIIVFPLYIGFFLLSLLIQKLERVKEISFGNAIYASLALSWPLSLAIIDVL